MKIEWRKHYKDIYLPKAKPELIELEEIQYLTIRGEGSPDSEAFTQSVEALYTLSYALKMAPRKGIVIDGYQEYAVFPLEGVWSFNEEGIRLYSDGVSANDLRDYFSFELMIRQPDFIRKELFTDLQELTYKKKNNEALLRVAFKTIKEPLSCQMMHIGPYKEETGSFKKMEEFVEKEGYIRKEKYHKEIYVSDPRRVAPEKLKTVLRFEIKKAN
ncbi:MAG: GyrI-like domain-containing protein [Tenericutes bacterium]|nr:GyrI-like domain-containing protein [Mycoplasmatota bacterium]